MRKVKWGILGCGKIASIFCTALVNVENAEVYAVATRNAEEYKNLGLDFVKKFNCKKSYREFDLLLNDQDIDIIYVALPHSIHKEYVLKALQANKNVMCEKPMGINANEVREMQELAKKNGLFLMEGLWTKFLPVTKKIKQNIEDGMIGNVKLVRAEFGFPAPNDINSRFRNPNLAGGSLLDIGIYTIAYVQMILGMKPLKVISLPTIGETGVDSSASVILDYGDGVRGEISISFDNFLMNQAMISGDKGVIVVDSFFSSESARIITQYGQKCELLSEPHKYNGYEYQADKVTQCILNNNLVCEEMTPEATLSLIEVMDLLRKDWGVIYPSERE